MFLAFIYIFRYITNFFQLYFLLNSQFHTKYVDVAVTLPNFVRALPHKDNFDIFYHSPAFQTAVGYFRNYLTTLTYSVKETV